MARNDTKNVVIPNLSEQYAEAMATLFEIQDKVKKLRDAGNFSSMKKVIDDELLKASVGKNKALSELVQCLDKVGLEQAELRIQTKCLEEADRRIQKEAKRKAYEASQKSKTE